jgi:hypothetical protein
VPRAPPVASVSAQKSAREVASACLSQKSERAGGRRRGERLLRRAAAAQANPRRPALQHRLLRLHPGAAAPTRPRAPRPASCPAGSISTC